MSSALEAITADIDALGEAARCGLLPTSVRRACAAELARIFEEIRIEGARRDALKAPPEYD